MTILQIMVAEIKGIVRFYSIETKQAFMSLDCGHVPLISADWCFGNSLRVATLAGTDWFVFDTSRSRCAIFRQIFRLAYSHDHVM